MYPLWVLPRAILPDDLAANDVTASHHLSDERIEHPVVVSVDGMKVAGLSQAVLRCGAASDGPVKRLRAVSAADDDGLPPSVADALHDVSGQSREVPLDRLAGCVVYAQSCGGGRGGEFLEREVPSDVHFLDV